MKSKFLPGLFKVAKALRRQWLAWLAVLLIGLVPGGTAVAAADSRGTDFWLTFLQNYSGIPTLTLFISGKTATTGSVDIPGLTFSSAFTVIPGATTSVVIPGAAQNSVSDRVQNLGIHVTSGAEVTVYGLNRIQYTTDAFLGLPTDILGTDYITLGYSGSGPEFGIVGTQTGTTVTITPSVAAGTRLAGVPYVITLNQGQTYQLESSSDLSGSLITADKPVAVFGGTQCANIPPGYGACDHLVEQLPPTSAWGKSFLTVPLATRTGGDTFRILAAQAGTGVSINGALVATLAKGQFHEQIIAGAAHITASGAVLVAQYSNGSDFDGVTSDPFMMLVTPYEQFLTDYTITTPASGFATNFINLVVANSEAGNITMDGLPVPATRFSAIGTSGYSGAQLPISLGTHNLLSSQPFGTFVYGFDSYDSYGYPGGGSLAPVAVVRSLTLTPKAASSPVNSRYCVNGLVADQNSLPVVGIRVDYTISGVNALTGSAITGVNGVAQYCYSGADIGTDTIAASSGSYTGTATVQWRSASVTPVPALSEWALLLLATLMATAAMLTLHKRETPG